MQTIGVDCHLGNLPIVFPKATFFETTTFTATVSDYLTDEQYRQLQADMLADPECGDVMPRTDGFRKLRWTDSRRGKGKRGGLRVIYYWLLAVARKGIVTLLLVLALPFARQAFSDAQRLGYMTKRRTGKHLIYRLAFEGLGKTSSGLGHEHSLR